MLCICTNYFFKIATNVSKNYTIQPDENKCISTNISNVFHIGISKGSMTHTRKTIIFVTEKQSQGSD